MDLVFLLQTHPLIPLGKPRLQECGWRREGDTSGQGSLVSVCPRPSTLPEFPPGNAPPRLGAPLEGVKFPFEDVGSPLMVWEWLVSILLHFCCHHLEAGTDH